MILLQRLDLVTALSQGGDAERGGLGATDSGHDGRIGVNGRGADFYFVSAWSLTRRGIDDEMDFAVLQEINGVRTAFVELKDSAHLESGSGEHGGGAVGGNEFEAQGGELFAERGDFVLVRVADAYEDATTNWQRSARGHL